MNHAAQHLVQHVPPRGRLRVMPANPRFIDAVLADLLAIRQTATGRAVFRRLRNAGRVVTIEQPNPPTDPPNAWTWLRSPHSRGKAEIVIVYDPADWPNHASRCLLTSDAILFGRLLDAVGVAVGAGGVDANVESPEMSAYLRERDAHGTMRESV